MLDTDHPPWRSALSALMGQAVLAVRAGLTVDVWADTIQPFPAAAEVFGAPLRDLTARIG